MELKLANMILASLCLEIIETLPWVSLDIFCGNCRTDHEHVDHDSVPAFVTLGMQETLR